MLLGVFLEQAHGHEPVADGRAGAQRRRDEDGLGEFFLGGARFHRVLHVRVNAVGALRGQGDGDGHQFPVLLRDDAVLALGGGLEVQERRSLFVGGLH